MIRKKFLILCLVYIVLSFFNLFTAMVDFQMEEAPLLVLKSPFASGNYIRTGEDKWLEENWTSDKWYARGEFIVITDTGGNYFIILIYMLFIYLWRICNIFLCIIIVLDIIKLIKNKKLKK